MKGFERPEMSVLSESSAIPEGHIVSPPENFTHEVTREQPYWYDRRGTEKPSGALAAGTKVLFLGEDDSGTRIVDPRGLIVTIERGALHKL
jgi:hypothetical protein